MSTEGGTKAVVAALTANLFIAVTKFAAWALTGASSMLAEAIHSVADSGNQLLLLLGGRRAKRAADQDHPFGYGRERYVYAFVVAIIIFLQQVPLLTSPQRAPSGTLSSNAAVAAFQSLATADWRYLAWSLGAVAVVVAKTVWPVNIPFLSVGAFACAMVCFSSSSAE